MIRVALLMAVAAMTIGCLDVGNDRVEQDRLVGKASVADARIEVFDGLATVRETSERSLTLWGNAPQFDVVIEPGTQTGTWTLNLWNVMSDVRVEIDGQRFEPDSQPIETRQSYTLEITEPTRVSVVAPDADDLSAFYFIAFADVQRRIDEVDDIYAEMAQFPEARFCLISGDLTPNGGFDEYVRFQREMEALPIPCFATLGNHDLSGENHYFHKFFGRGNQSWVFRGVRFTFVDSASAGVSTDAWPWIDQWLTDGEDGAHLVMMHIPPLDPDGFRNGAFATRAEANKFINKLNKYNVDIAIYGHVHSFYAFTDGDVPSYVTGGGGGIPQRFDGIGRHFLLIRGDSQTQKFNASVERVFPD